MSKKNDVLAKEVEISEAYLTALFWVYPDQYTFHPEDRLSFDIFHNRVWAFYFTLGRHMADKNIRKFDDISVANVIKQLGSKIEKEYNEFGGFNTIKEMMAESKGKFENLEAYYEEVKKYALLRNFRGLFGDKVVEQMGNYDYRKMTKDQIFTYWTDKVNKVGLDGDNKYDEHFLLKGLRESLDDWDKNPDIGLPFYKSKHLTKICTGFAEGSMYIYGGFGGSGKTSFSFAKVIMSHIENKEKLLILANEQSIEEFKKMLIITAMGYGTKEAIQRSRLNEGNFSVEEKEKLEKAVEWVEQLCGGEDSLITFVFMENYVIEDVKKIVRYYANRGYQSVMIDTGKPSDGGNQNEQRHAKFADDFKELYKLVRPNGNGLNLRMWVNVQLTDSAITRRYLNEGAFGESKKIKNEASVVFMGRFAWADEYDGEKHEIIGYRFVKDAKNPFGYRKEEFTLEKGKQYYLIFTPKNRRGQDNRTGCPVLIVEPNFNNNTWRELGFCQIVDTKDY